MGKPAAGSVLGSDGGARTAGGELEIKNLPLETRIGEDFPKKQHLNWVWKDEYQPSRRVRWGRVSQTEGAALSGVEVRGTLV